MQAMLGEIIINKWLIYEWSIYIYKSMKFQPKFLPVRLVDPCDLSQVGIRTCFQSSFMGFEETCTKHWPPMPPMFSLDFCSLQVFNLANIGMIKLIKLMHIYPSKLSVSIIQSCMPNIHVNDAVIVIPWPSFYSHHFLWSGVQVLHQWLRTSRKYQFLRWELEFSSNALYVAIILVGIWVGRVGVEF